MTGPLQGIPHRRTGRHRPGAVRRMMLADHGETVIRVECEDRPPKG
ncbi:MAG: hypothetical protein ACXWUQ_14115 [Allosphingosinicella sp.]